MFLHLLYHDTAIVIKDYLLVFDTPIVRWKSNCYALNKFEITFFFIYINVVGILSIHYENFSTFVCEYCRKYRIGITQEFSLRLYVIIRLWSLYEPQVPICASMWILNGGIKVIMLHKECTSNKWLPLVVAITINTYIIPTNNTKWE